MKNEIVKTVVLRNRCLKLFFSLLYSGKKIHVGYCEDVVQVVGFDWIQLFLQGHLHPVSWAVLKAIHFCCLIFEPKLIQWGSEYDPLEYQTLWSSELKWPVIQMVGPFALAYVLDQCFSTWGTWAPWVIKNPIDNYFSSTKVLSTEIEPTIV